MQYIGAMAHDLEKMALQNGFGTLAYLFAAAALEAGQTLPGEGERAVSRHARRGVSRRDSRAGVEFAAAGD